MPIARPAGRSRPGSAPSLRQTDQHQPRGDPAEARCRLGEGDRHEGVVGSQDGAARHWHFIDAGVQVHLPLHPRHGERSARRNVGRLDLDWVFVGDPGNAADTPSSNCVAANCGSVGYEYSVAKYEVTNAQYAEFLNAKAQDDPLGLYDTNMGAQAQGGITRSGSPGSYPYAVKPGFADKTVNYVRVAVFAAFLSFECFALAGRPLLGQYIGGSKND